MEGNRRDGTAMEWFRDLTDDGYGVVAIDYRLGLKGGRGVTASEFVVLLERAINLAVEDLFSATSSKRLFSSYSIFFQSIHDKHFSFSNTHNWQHGDFNPFCHRWGANGCQP